jgi:hypothetical protein
MMPMCRLRESKKEEASARPGRSVVASSLVEAWVDETLVDASWWTHPGGSIGRQQAIPSRESARALDGSIPPVDRASTSHCARWTVALDSWTALSRMWTRVFLMDSSGIAPRSA